MGISWSSGNRRNNYPYYGYPPPPPPQPPLPAPPSRQLTYYCPSDHPPPPTPPAPHNYVYATPPMVQPSYYYPGWQSSGNYSNPWIGGAPNYLNYHANQWEQMGPSVIAPAPYVEHQNAKKVKNDVNVRKDTIRVEVDEGNQDQYLVSFVFDALFDGSITIYYFAKEESNGKVTPAYPEAYTPMKVPFRKGMGQKFRQPSGTGIDLGFFVLDDLAKPSPGDDIFPLVIYAECSSSHTIDEEHVADTTADMSPRVQITQAVLEKKDGEPFQVKMIRQILWIEGVRYELRELYGIGNSSDQSFNDEDPGKECVICMTEQKDTAIMPCRHLCMCSDCAKELRLQSNKCPICREPIEELIEIKVNSGGSSSSLSQQ